MTADFSRGLPDLRAGVYRHWKGHHYLVLGYGHDANADSLYTDPLPFRDEATPLGVRTVVVYVGLELDDAHKGPRLAVRTAEDFFALVCSACGDPWECDLPHIGVPAEPVPRFEYLGPAWYGWKRNDPAPSGTRPGPDTAADARSGTGTPERPQTWAPCPVRDGHEPHGPAAPRPKCPGVPPRYPVNATEPYGERA